MLEGMNNGKQVASAPFFQLQEPVMVLSVFISPFWDSALVSAARKSENS